MPYPMTPRRGRPPGVQRDRTPSPSQRVLLERLGRARGDWVNIEALAAAVYAGAEQPMSYRLSLAVMICSLRRRYGYNIVNRYGGDYALLEFS